MLETKIFDIGTSLTQKIFRLAQEIFRFGQNAGCFALGAKEIIFDGLKISWFYICHGILYMASGIAGAVCFANSCRLIDLGRKAALIDAIASRLFFTANVLSLAYFANEFIESVISCTKKGTAEKPYKQIISSALGIINAFGYTVAIMNSHIGGPLIVTAIAGSVALLAGCIKFVADSFFDRKSRKG